MSHRGEGGRSSATTRVAPTMDGTKGGLYLHGDKGQGDHQGRPYYGRAWQAAS